ncbi:MAG TPA: hypothetical protein PKM67_08985 [Kiritimatiellia bacterium]|nr:hypothetical protein [Kiritimatiellia bacterium]
MRPIRLIHLLSAILIPVMTCPAIAETPDGYFNESAYLYTDKKQEKALEKVNTGLQSYPDNPKLKMLKELLEKSSQQQQEQEQPQNQPEQNQDQQNQQPQEEQSGQDEQQEQPQPKPSDEMSKEEAEMMLDAMKKNEKSQREQIQMLLGKPLPVDKDW